MKLIFKFLKKLPVNALLPPLFWKFLFLSMITFYECLLEYQKRPDSIKFSKKKLKKLHQYIKLVYDRNKNPPISYLESQEGDKIYQVRGYPDSFKKTIIGLLNRLHEKEAQRLQIIPKPVKKLRKRKIIIKPQFSAKPKLKYES